MPLPQNLLRLVDLWKQDQASLIGRAVAMVETSEIDDVERHRAQLSQLSGVSETRIQEIVDTARTVFGITDSAKDPRPAHSLEGLVEAVRGY